MKYKIHILVILIGISFFANGQNLRQISNREGISNNAVLSLCQDKDGYIWLGTCEGVNIWDGKEMYTFDQTKIKNKNLCNNLIEEFIQTTDRLFWIRTNYGLNKIDPRSKESEMHQELSGLYKFTARKSNEVFVITQENKLFFYNQLNNKFNEVNIKGLKYSQTTNIFLDDNDKLWFFSTNRAFYFPIKYSKNIVKFGKPSVINYNDTFYHIEIADRKIYMVTSKGVFYEFDPINNQLVYKADISTEHNKRGEVSKIIQDGNDYFIAFLTNGLIKLKFTPEKSTKFQIENIPIKCGIFSLLKDKNQEIVWIGTDGQGLFQYTKSSIVFNSTTYNQFPYKITKPTRVLYIDRNKDLWIGTKDDGIFKIKDFYTVNDLNLTNTISINTQNSELLNNSVYTFSQSVRNLFWIGSDGQGLNYYSYKDNKIHVLKTKHPIAHVHGLTEINDSTLWIVTGGQGVYKISIGGNYDNPVIKNEIQIFIDKELLIKNLYFSICQESDSIIWFGNRGGGAVRYNILNNRKKIIRFESPSFQAVNDIFAICRSDDGVMWFGTGSGLIRYSSNSKIKSRLLTKTTIHAMQMDPKGNLWISTNNGLIKYSSLDKTIASYGYPYGLNVIEYSDGAFYTDKDRQIMFFGGINGFVSINETAHQESFYSPKLLFKDIRINDNIFSVNELSDNDGDVVMKYNQNYFTLTVAALDYINGSNYTYQYKLDDRNGWWTGNVNSNKLSFSNLKSGNYNLQVRYHNNLTNYNSSIYQLKIHILPPWYTSLLAKTTYALLILLVIGFTIKMLFNRLQKRRLLSRQKLEQAQKEEMYESKLRFFTNITQELSTPLTLISGPCQQIAGYPNADEYVIDKAQTIQHNASKLNELIYMLNEFKVSGSESSVNEIELLDISHISNEIARQFIDHANQSDINFKLNIEDKIVWASDKNRFLEMLDSFLTFAFKNTNSNGGVGLKMYSQNENLYIDINTTGNQVKMEFLNLIFDRYKVMDYLEKSGKKGLSFRASLELAIAHNIVKSMNGEVDINTKNEGNTIIFHIKLPKLEISKEIKSGGQIVFPDKAFKLQSVEKKEYTFDKNKQTILLMMENMEIMNFVAEIFDEQYNIKSVFNSSESLEFLNLTHPNIIICGITSQLSKLIDFIKTIKESKQTSHIPIAVLSTSQQKEEQIKVIESGADICLVLPFDVKYLKAVTEQLLKNSESLKDYYRSSLSSFEMIEGKLLHKEDKEFMEKMMRVISDNLTNPSISTEFVANEMRLSVRSLYRRLEGITSKTPTDIIKEYRLQRAEQLLITTKLSIDEIIYKSGFNNRGTFFKSFSGKYGCTPKAYREIKSRSVPKNTTL